MSVLSLSKKAVLAVEIVAKHGNGEQRSDGIRLVIAASWLPVMRGHVMPSRLSRYNLDGGLYPIYAISMIVR